MAGAISGNLELLDFDFLAELFNKWAVLVETAAPGLLPRLVIEKSQSGGKHVVYRCEEAVERNQDLAVREWEVTSPENVEYGGKSIKPAKLAGTDHWFVEITLIETRGEGGIFLCAPSPGYELIQGSFDEIPVITAAERKILIDAAKSLNEKLATQTEPSINSPAPSCKVVSTSNGELRPGDDFNARGDVRSLLIKHGWTPAGPNDGGELFRRPGKEGDGASASLKDQVFFVHSTNASPFEAGKGQNPPKGYSAFEVFCLLEHGGDFSRAAKALATQGYGTQERGRQFVAKESNVALQTGKESKFIVEGFDTHRVIDECIEALTVGGERYRYSGKLVEIRGSDATDDQPRIVPLTEARIQDLLSASCRYGKEVVDKKGEIVFKEKEPSRAVLRGILERGEYPTAPPLNGLADAPFVTACGKVVAKSGYDPITKTYLILRDSFPTIKDRPTLEDAKAALIEVLELVSDYNFEGDVDRSAWLAGLLTVFARPAINGCVPFFCVDGTTAGTGKGKLVDAIATIATGRPAPRLSWSDGYAGNETNKKLITAKLLQGSRITLFDNTNQIGGPALDAAITAPTWSDRILGVSQMTAEIPVNTVFFSTGINTKLLGDLGRRALMIRIETKCENPEERTGFRHADLDGYVKQNRVRLAVACLTIVKAYFAADRPEFGLPAWGSFESWSRIIRNTIVWLGLPDPYESHRKAAKQGNRRLSETRLLIDAWERIDPERRGLTSRQCFDLIGAGNETLINLFEELLPEGKDGKPRAPTKQSIPKKLAEFRGAVAGDLRFDIRTAANSSVFVLRPVGFSPEVGQKLGEGASASTGAVVSPAPGLQSQVSKDFGEQGSIFNYLHVKDEEENIDMHTGPVEVEGFSAPLLPCSPSICLSCNAPLITTTQFDGYRVVECPSCSSVFQTLPPLESVNG